MQRLKPKEKRRLSWSTFAITPLLAMLGLSAAVALLAISSSAQSSKPDANASRAAFLQV